MHWVIHKTYSLKISILFFTKEYVFIIKTIGSKNNCSHRIQVFAHILEPMNSNEFKAVINDW